MPVKTAKLMNAGPVKKRSTKGTGSKGTKTTPNLKNIKKK